VSKFGHEKERATRTIQQLKDKIAVLELAEAQRVKLERENSHLAAELENYSGLQGEYDSATEQISSITARLKEQTER
jgi:cell shape-determining protein MreC